MNWEAIGAIGEILGALAVVISLLYLAAQIRQNSRVVKGTSAQSITQTIQSELRWSGDMAEIMVKVINDPDSLTPIEAFKAGEWATAAMWARQNEYIQYQQQLIDEDVWYGCRGILENTFSIPWMRSWWQSFDKTVFTEEFLALANEVTSDHSDYDYKKYVREISNDRKIISDDA